MGEEMISYRILIIFGVNFLGTVPSFYGMIPTAFFRIAFIGILDLGKISQQGGLMAHLTKDKETQMRALGMVCT